MRKHETSLAELHDLRALVERDLSDARIAAVSPDRRFATAYNAVLQLTKMAIACEGYRVVGLGHHRTTFEALELAMGAQVARFVPYFDQCRRKRNQVDYDCANVATDTEAKALLSYAVEFQRVVEAWIQAEHPEYAAEFDS